MDSKTYWKNRETANLKSNLKTEAEYAKEIENIYSYMMDQITKEINGFYTKYASAEGITMSEAKKKVAKLDIEEYERKAAKYVKDKTFTSEANEEMRLYNATMKINRLEMLKANIGLEMVDGFNDLQQYFDQALTERTLSEFERQAGILGNTIQNNAKMAESIVDASFKNARFSDRVWMYQDMLKSELSKLLQEGLIQGRNPKQLATHLEKVFGVSQYNAERLMRTELARVQTDAQKQSFIANGFDEYQFNALGTACEICAAIDGKHFKIEDMMPGTNAPPMHPNCVLPETKIIAPDIEAMTRSWYSGDIVEFGTSNGRRLSVTPNHIVLTARGWVRAKNLIKGDKVICYRANVCNGIHAKPANNDSAVIAENLFTALIKTSGRPPLSVPVSPVDFKGDVVADSKVDIVPINSKLRDKLDSSFSQFISDSLLIGTGKFSERELPFKSTLATLLVGIGLAADGIMSGLRVASVLFGGALGHHELVSLRLVSDYDARLQKTAMNGWAAGSQLFRDGFFTHSRSVESDDFTNINIETDAFQDDSLALKSTLDCRALNASFISNGRNRLTGIVRGDDSINIDADSSVVGFDAATFEDIRNNALSDAIGIGDIVRCFSTFIEFDDISFVLTSKYSGHVYDTSCVSTLYICNDILSSNCRCSTSAYMDDKEYNQWLDTYQDHGLSFEDWRSEKNVANNNGSDIIEADDAKEVSDVHSVGKIDKSIYSCITDDIVTDEVIITDNQIQHIKDRHPDAYKTVVSHLKDVIQSPDYIIRDKHPNTGLIVKQIQTEESQYTQVVLRICTSEDEPGYKNSIISCWEISESRLQNYLRNKTILYKRE